MIIGLSNAFSAGVFLAIALLHILPEASQEYQDAIGGNPYKNFPLPFLMAIVTYAFVLFIEKIAFDSLNILEEHHPNDQLGLTPRILSHESFVSKASSKKKVDIGAYGREEELKRSLERAKQAQEIGKAVNMRNERETEESPLGQMEEEDRNEEIFKELMNYQLRVAQQLKEYSQKGEDDEEREENHTLDDLEGDDKENGASLKKNLLEDFAGSVPRTKSSGSKRSIGHHSNVSQESRKAVSTIGSIMKPFLFLVALSFHGTIEGMAVGLQTTFYNASKLCLAIVLHKWAEALTLGVSFSKASVNHCTALMMVLIFSFAAPVGVLLGIMLSGLGAKATAIIMSCASGSFFFCISFKFTIFHWFWWKLSFVF